MADTPLGEVIERLERAPIYGYATGQQAVKVSPADRAVILAALQAGQEYVDADRLTAEAYSNYEGVLPSGLRRELDDRRSEAHSALLAAYGKE